MLIAEDELLALLLSFTVLIIFLLNRQHLKRVPFVRVLFTAFFLLFSAWLASVAEGIFLPTLLNIVEHVLYLVSAFCLLFWAIRVRIIKNGLE